LTEAFDGNTSEEARLHGMEIIRTIEGMKKVAQEARAARKAIGLVPTMGALHAGHFSLVRSAQAQSSPVVVSIFVNPMQFGLNEDFDRYPRAWEQDCAALESLAVDYVFAPAPEEMYQSGFRTSVIVEGLSERLEGRSRPGHFRGVATVVLKLFEIVQPSFAFFGQKDAQQVRIIEQMAGDLNVGVTVVRCPILREPDGLAFSSRNAYLSPQDRRAATALYRALDCARRRIAAGEVSAKRLACEVRECISKEELVTAEYVEIVEAESFEPVEQLCENCLLLVAARVGSVRLIDNARIVRRGYSYQAEL
jgi:pantoate--beta-alanine ligase